MRFCAVALVLVCGMLTAQPQTPADPLREARAAVNRGDSEGARALLMSMRESGLQTRDDLRVLQAVQMLAYLSRVAGDLAATEDWLAEALDCTGRLRGYNSIDVADIRVDIAGVRRLRKNAEGAIASLQEALNKTMFPPPGDRIRAARIATTMGHISLEQKDNERARSQLQLAVQLWNETMRDDPELLPALETLGAMYRDDSNYEAALPLFTRALRIREMSFGAASAELIVGLDNAAYVLFGLKRYAEAEPLYARLLQTWLETAGSDHPMVALTLDKMAEFFAAQKRIAEAGEMARRATEIRARSLAESLRLRARLAAEAGSVGEAERLRKQGAAALDLAGIVPQDQPIQPAPAKAKPLRAKPRK